MNLKLWTFWKHQEVPIILINILTYNFINLPIKNFKQVEADKRIPYYIENVGKFKPWLIFEFLLSYRRIKDFTNWANWNSLIDFRCLLVTKKFKNSINSYCAWYLKGNITFTKLFFSFRSVCFNFNVF